MDQTDTTLTREVGFPILRENESKFLPVLPHVTFLVYNMCLLEVTSSQDKPPGI